MPIHRFPLPVEAKGFAIAVEVEGVRAVDHFDRPGGLIVGVDAPAVGPDPDLSPAVFQKIENEIAAKRFCAGLASCTQVLDLLPVFIKDKNALPEGADP